MARYFLEVAYKGTRYSGFQVQQNAKTIQSEIQHAFAVLHRQPVVLTGSSRTDTGVHALQNYFHFDTDLDISPQFIYKMNALLPDDIVVKNLYTMPADAHSRFDAVSRAYTYKVYQFKNPFLKEVAFYYPYKLDLSAMQEAAALVKEQNNFFPFCKTNTQVSNFKCTIYSSSWMEEEGIIRYSIEGNRFLRGMVRLLTATMLKVGRRHISMQQLESFFTVEGMKCGYSVPATGLFLQKVQFPEDYFNV